jgi:3-oxoadipate enol-lactonase
VTEGVTDHAGARIAWSVDGAGEPLVLLNSIGTDRRLWDGMIDPLVAAGHRLLRIDTRGHGRSDAPTGDYSLEMLAADVAAMMDDAGMANAAVAGVSLGGMIAMQLAVDRPERVTRLVLICTSATMDRDAWAARVDTTRSDGMAAIAPIAMPRFLSPAFIADHPVIARGIEHDLRTMSADGYAGCAAAIRDMDLLPRLSGIDAPTLVVTGSRDVSTPRAGHGDRLLAEIPGSTEVQLDCAHLPPIETPDVLAAVMIDHLR